MLTYLFQVELMDIVFIQEPLAKSDQIKGLPYNIGMEIKSLEYKYYTSTTLHYIVWSSKGTLDIFAQMT